MRELACYCINLRERPDRKARIKQLFHRLGIEVEFWTVERHPDGGRYGCFESHVQLWLNSPARITLIMEDDLEFAGTRKEFHSLLREACSLVDKYQTVHLGRIPVKLGKYISPKFLQGKFLTLSCYLGRTDKLRILAPKVLPYYGMHLDTVLAFSSEQVALDRNLFRQEFSDSDNSWTDGLPVISLLNLDQKFRKLLQHDLEAFARLPGWIWTTMTSFVIGVNTFQQGLTQLIRKPEFKDRRK